MKPYYEHAGITIYHGDCREILPALEADVLITDPPYGVEFSGKNTKHTRRDDSGYRSGEDDGSIGPDVIRSTLGRVKRAIVFPGTRKMFQYPEPDDVGCVFCPSGAGIGRWGFTCFHPVLFYGKRPGPGLYPSSFASFAQADYDAHPCAKPLQWMVWAIKLGSLESEVIIDPFCGSGTTLRAAKDLYRRAIGIEIDEQYCELAALRLSQEVFSFESKSVSAVL